MIRYEVRSKSGRLRQLVKGHFGKDIPIAFDGSPAEYDPAADAIEREAAARAILKWLPSNAMAFDRLEHLSELCRHRSFCEDVLKNDGFIEYAGRYEPMGL